MYTHVSMIHMYQGGPLQFYTHTKHMFCCNQNTIENVWMWCKTYILIAKNIHLNAFQPLVNSQTQDILMIK